MQVEDVPEASTVLARAYCTNPIQIAVFQEQDGDLLCQKAMFKKSLEHATGQVFVARREGQVNPDEPVRWMLVKREAGIPDGEQQSDRWRVDHLLLDQNAIPTFVETPLRGFD